jgi:hypothetical protein
MGSQFGTLSFFFFSLSVRGCTLHGRTWAGAVCPRGVAVPTRGCGGHGKNFPPLQIENDLSPRPSYILIYQNKLKFLSISHTYKKLKLNKMKQIKVLNSLSETLVLLLEDLTNLLNDIDSGDLVREIESNVVSPIENAQAQLDIILDDIEDGVYDDYSEEEEFEEWE